MPEKKKMTAEAIKGGAAGGNSSGAGFKKNRQS